MECDGMGMGSFTASPTGFFNEFLLCALNGNGLRGHERAWIVQVGHSNLLVQTSFETAPLRIVLNNSNPLVRL
jgi:hypothetical protein